MKFGDTLYQRSVPKWAAYNLNYNELKHLIKLRTTTGNPNPVPIPGQTDHRWSILEDELYAILKEQYDNITLFLRSKNGEIERRLAHLDKSVRSAKRSANVYSGRSALLARKFQRLVQEADAIGEDIQSLSRFAATQKTAFRKILKKYRKWTHSESLQQRLELEVFADGHLHLNLADQMQHLALQTATIKDLEASLLRPRLNGSTRASSLTGQSPVTLINKAASKGPLHFDAAFASTEFGESAGLATYWVHPDNLSEVKVLLLKYARELEAQPLLSRENSSESITSSKSLTSTIGNCNTCYLDNSQRYKQSTSNNSPSRVALSATWSESKEALVTMSDMSPHADSRSTVIVKRKDLANALDRDASLSKDKSASAANTRIVKEFLTLHRDVRCLAMSRSSRIRYVGLNNSAEVGNFAVLDTNVVTATFNKQYVLKPNEDIEGAKSFPHAILTIRWEFGRRPEVARAFDTSHLAECVENFSLEAAAITLQNPELGHADWEELMERDIRKVPLYIKTKRDEVPMRSTSAPSSTDGPSDSVFSAQGGYSNTASDTSPMASTRDLPMHNGAGKPGDKKKKARIVAQSPKRPAARYYSEYDDPDSEMYQQEAYTIYVDPNAEAPGVATMRQIGNAISQSFAWFQPTSKAKSKPGEQTPLLHGQSDSNEDEEQSSESDSEEAGVPKYKGLQGRMRPAERYRRRLSRRQRSFERTLIKFSSGMVVLSYVFLLMSAILLTTGRKKEILEVDVGATVGVIMAFSCMLLSCVLVYMRRSSLTSVEKVALSIADGMIVVLGAGVVVGIVQRPNYHG